MECLLSVGWAGALHHLLVQGGNAREQGSHWLALFLICSCFVWVRLGFGSCSMSTPFSHRFFNPSLKPSAPTAREALLLSYHPQSYKVYGWTKGFLHLPHKNPSVDKINSTRIAAVSQTPLWKAWEPQRDGSARLALWGHEHWEPPRCQIQVGS